MLYSILKFTHIVGVILLLGNVTVTSVWKVFADRTRRPETIAFAQRIVVGTDWTFTLCGIVLTMVGGYGMAALGSWHLTATTWLAWSQILFVASGAIWLGALVPLQIAQKRMALQFAHGDAIPDAYWTLGRKWLGWGLLATVPLFAALFLMTVKP